MKQIFLAYGLMGALLAVGCSGGSNNPDQPPEGVLQPDTMKQVLMDIHIAEAALERKQLKDDTAAIQVQQYYNEIYQVHDITEDQFMKSMEYYRNRPQQFQTMYEELIKTMSQKEAELSGEEE